MEGLEQKSICAKNMRKKKIYVGRGIYARRRMYAREVEYMRKKEYMRDFVAGTQKVSK